MSITLVQYPDINDSLTFDIYTLYVRLVTSSFVFILLNIIY